MDPVLRLSSVCRQCALKSHVSPQYVDGIEIKIKGDLPVI